MLGFRPRHRKLASPKDVVPIHHTFHIGEVSTPRRHSHLNRSSLGREISSGSSSDRYGETGRISRGSSRESSMNGDSDSEWQRWTPAIIIYHCYALLITNDYQCIIISIVGSAKGFFYNWHYKHVWLDSMVLLGYIHEECQDRTKYPRRDIGVYSL